MSLKIKLIAGFGGMLAVFLCMAMFNIHQVKLIKDQLVFQNGKVELKQMALELKETVQELNIIASGLEISKKPEYIPIYNEKRKQFDQMIKQIGDTATTPDQIAWRSKLISLTVDYANTFDVAAKLVQENKLPPVDMDKNMEYLYNESQKLKDEIFSNVDKFYVVYSEDASTAIAASHTMLDDTLNIMVLLSIVVAAASIALAYALIRSFVRPILRLQTAVGLIAAGDLRHKINNRSRDELGVLSQSFDLMVDHVNNMLARTQAIAYSLADHSHSFQSFASSTASANSEIVKSIQEMSTGAQQQAEQSEKSSLIISDLDQELRLISNSMQTIRLAGEHAAHNTELGTSAIDTLRLKAEQSEQILASVSEAMETLNASSRQIGTITASITEISAQTNILSLNASIEAARAGVHGRGFTVIADEVRNLSTQTSKSAQSIAGIIHTLRTRMNELQASINSAQVSMSEQNAKVHETTTAFASIRSSMEELSGQIDQVHHKVEEAKHKNETLVDSVQYVAAIAQQTAAGVEEITSTSLIQDASLHKIASEADDIHMLSQKLFQEINQFQIDVKDQPADMELTLRDDDHKESETMEWNIPFAAEEFSAGGMTEVNMPERALEEDIQSEEMKPAGSTAEQPLLQEEPAASGDPDNSQKQANEKEKEKESEKEKAEKQDDKLVLV
ncbi:methyl-accepting chemotaxis protein [Paenibacillus thalictri]|nr:methyl-accepting chemotaxis protein [Paenibacillus thalictri]